MTPEEQQQVNAAMAYMERQCGNLAREGAQMAGNLEACAQQLKVAQERIKELTPSPVMAESNVVPITEPAA